MSILSLVRSSFFVGLRYSLYPKQNRFISIVSMVSFLGMVLGVCSLITVLSVMNGFAFELTDRILSLTSHGRVYSEHGVKEWQQLREKLLSKVHILEAQPYVERKVIISSAGAKKGVMLTGVSPFTGGKALGSSNTENSDTFSLLGGDPYKIVLGASLARMLGVIPGDSVEVITSRILITPLGLFPRTKTLSVVGFFEVGAQPDLYQGFVSLQTAQKLFGLGSNVDGLQIKTNNLYGAPSILSDMASSLPDGLAVSSWDQSQGSLFAAIRMEKILVTTMLLSVIFVAAFNIVSTLVISVSEKKRDIAVFRTMGMQASNVSLIFVMYGMILSSLGVFAGAVFGVLLSLNISKVTNYFESWFNTKLFDPSVYFISELPSRLLFTDVCLVSIAALFLSSLATLYPSWKAARIMPSEVLRYE